ncbi:MAG TPA: DUF2309 domain-containing protein [Pirellulaceae bacterium]|nr:DUF2309 domain-containing protein [Pirellulaceae bacterium]
MPLLEASSHSSPTARNDETLAHLRQSIDRAVRLLPVQGPIRVFVAQNTFQALEHLPFDQAVVEGARLYGGQPYLPETRYRELMASGRIRAIDLRAVVDADPAVSDRTPIAGLATRRELRLAMLEHPIRSAPTAELRWLVAETDALRVMRSDVAAPIREQFVERTRRWIMRDVRDGKSGERAEGRAAGLAANVDNLIAQFGAKSIDRWSGATWEAFALQLTWRLAHQGGRSWEPPAHRPLPGAIRLRQLLLDATGVDIDPWVDDLLIRFCSAFLDQGFARWQLPGRERGFFGALAEHLRALPSPEPWFASVRAELDRYEAAGSDPIASILDSLADLGIGPAEFDDYVTATLMVLRGWAGMIRQIETRGDRAVAPIPAGSLDEYLAARLILERSALRYAARRQLKFAGTLAELRRSIRRPVDRHDGSGLEQRTFRLFQVAQLLGWDPSRLYPLSREQWHDLVGEIETFSGLERRATFHRAYERQYRDATLDALAVRARQRGTESPKSAAPNADAANGNGPLGNGSNGHAAIATPSGRRSSAANADTVFQLIACIDDREESFRRHLEEVCPQAETFGAAGFFSVAMYYRGAADAHYVPLCPIVIQPSHYVREDVMVRFEESHRRRAATRAALGNASHQMHVGSRTIAGGALLTGLFGPLASVPLVARVLFPRLTGQIRRLAASVVQPPPLTQLELERTTAEPGNVDGSIGFTVDEMIGIGQRLLTEIGLVERFAPLVFVMGHGSSSYNNPHKSAYDCGACGGGGGGPNARALAEMLNDIRVRDGLAERGIRIPRETWFVGGIHNTCDDSVECFDLERLPKSHQRRFGEAFAAIDRACDRNAHERCRRFVSAPLDLTFEGARRHVQGRSEDLAQTRPEFGHASTAICVVGRRERTRGLFMDRRAFLTSYDPTRDDSSGTILTRVLQAVVPVCSGISLQYFFSNVDSNGLGSGTKLPHNVTGLLGVMDGPSSDLRTGLPWQGVEIHEPIRLLFVIESTVPVFERILDAFPTIARVFRNEWVQVALLDPDSSRIDVFERGTFRPYRPSIDELPTVHESPDWYRGWRDHLGFALIDPAVPPRRPERP